MPEFKYTIGDKRYCQRPLVMGQVDQLLEVLESAPIKNVLSAWDIKKSLGENLYLCLAIVLIEEGKTARRTMDELRALADEIRWSIDPETEVEVIENFFDCNPVARIMERLPELQKGLVKKLLETAFVTPLSASQKETSPGETPSSGDSRPDSAPLTLDIA